jgi:hypothetical protein
VIGPQGNGAIEAGKRFRVPPERAERIAKIVLGGWMMGIDRQRPADELDSLRMVAPLRTERAEELQRLKVVGLASEYRAVERSRGHARRTAMPP